MNRERLEASIKDHEGYRSEPYLDHLGKLTVGWGHLIEHQLVGNYPSMSTLGEVFRQLCDPEIHQNWLEQDIDQAIADAQRFLDDDDYESLTSDQQDVVCEMAYQLGLTRLSTFVKFKAAIHDGDDELATDQMIDSLWYRQTPARAQELADKFYS